MLLCIKDLTIYVFWYLKRFWSLSHYHQDVEEQCLGYVPFVCIICVAVHMCKHIKCRTSDVSWALKPISRLPVLWVLWIEVGRCKKGQWEALQRWSPWNTSRKERFCEASLMPELDSGPWGLYNLIPGFCLPSSICQLTQSSELSLYIHFSCPFVVVLEIRL